MRRIEVANVQAAVDMAAKFQQDGEYNWFRGQTVERAPQSSLARVQLRNDTEALEHNTRRISMFCRWLGKTPQLSYLLEPQSVHQFFAILQHYGVATYYLDFSTDPGVAGFFACDTNAPPTSGMCCIYCLDTQDLWANWITLSKLKTRKGAEMERIVVDVQNLWRLQAQAGVFLYTNYNWDIDYPMDRIVFPYTGYPTVPTKDRIYPKEHSALELLLDQYFDVERATFANELMRQMTADLQKKGRNASFVTMKTFDRGLYTAAFRDAAALQPSTSWNAPDLVKWHHTPNELFHETVGRTLRLQLGNNQSADSIGATIKYGVVQSLRSAPNLRSYAIEFVIEGHAADASPSGLTHLLQRAWNGMRALPFTNDDIGDCLGRVAQLHALGFATMDIAQRHASLAERFGTACRVAFGPQNGAGTQAWVTKTALLAAVRKDMPVLLDPLYQARVNDISELFKVIYNPQLTFEFDAFARIFARELIATQVLDGRAYIHFNPATVETFGNP